MLFNGFLGFIKFVNQPRLRIFTLTLLYYASLYFSIHNRSLLIFTLVYFIGLWLLTKSLTMALFLTFIVTLPFAKGKGFQIILLPKDQITRYALFKISYFFPLYLSDVFLFLLIWQYVRHKLKGNYLIITSTIKWPLIFFTFFISWIAISGATSTFPEVTWLSTVQLIRMFCVLFAPLIIMQFRNHIQKFFYPVIIAGLIFQSTWVLLQRLHGGPLGRDLEVFLPGTEFGIRSSENVELLRSSGTFFEPSILGTFLLMHIFLLSLAILEKRMTSKPLLRISLVAILAGSLALAFTGSRILYAMWILFIIFLIRKYIKRFERIFVEIRNYLTPLRVIFTAVILGFLLIPYLWGRITSLNSIFSEYGTASYRMQMALYSFRLAQFRPLEGVGINLSPYHLATGFVGERYIFDPTYPHNLMFQLLAETGAVGLILFILFTYTSLRPVFSGKPGSRLNEFGFAALIYFISAQVYPIFINHQEIASFFFLYIGMYFATTNPGKRIYA